MRGYSRAVDDSDADRLAKTEAKAGFMSKGGFPMKQRNKLCLTLVLMLLGLFSLTTQAGAKPSFKTLCTYNTKARFSYKVDMTGDGKADTLAFKIGAQQSNATQRILIQMNGTRVLLGTVPYSYGYDIQYIALTNKAQFLYIHGKGDSNMPGLHTVFRYDASKKRLVKALNLGTYLGTAGLVTKVTSSTISMSNGCMPRSVGRISWTFVFKYNTSKGIFTLSRPTAAVKSAVVATWNDGYDYYFKKSRYVASKSFSTYTSVSMKQKAYTVAVKDVLQMTKIGFYKKGLYIQFKNKAGKAGWIHAYQAYNTGSTSNLMGSIFYGVDNRSAGGFYG